MGQRERAITILGSGTCQLEPHRAASSVLIEMGETRVVYDMGRSVSNRLVEAGLMQDDIQHIIISHFHVDHFSDLGPFLQAACWSRVDPRTKDLNIYGPPGMKDIFNTICKLYTPEALLAEDRFTVNIFELDTGSHEVAGLNFDYVHLPPANNHGLRFEFEGQQIAITGDSHFHQEEVEFMKTVDIAVIDSGHLEDGEIVDLAAKSNPKTIYCSHLYRELELEVLQSEASSKGFTGVFKRAKDLERIL